MRKFSMPAPKPSTGNFSQKPPELDFPSGKAFLRGCVPVSWDALFRRAEARTVKRPRIKVVHFVDFEIR